MFLVHIVVNKSYYSNSTEINDLAKMEEITMHLHLFRREEVLQEERRRLTLIWFMMEQFANRIIQIDSPLSRHMVKMLVTGSPQRQKLQNVHLTLG